MLSVKNAFLITNFVTERKIVKIILMKILHCVKVIPIFRFKLLTACQFFLPQLCSADETSRRDEVCLEDQWKCYTGDCINKNFVCDSTVDCPDSSDENDDLCNVLSFSPKAFEETTTEVTSETSEGYTEATEIFEDSTETTKNFNETTSEVSVKTEFTSETSEKHTEASKSFNETTSVNKTAVSNGQPVCVTSLIIINCAIFSNVYKFGVY